MNTEKIKTLEHILDAMDIVENARAISGLTQEERYELERTAIQLRNAQRAIIRAKTKEMISKLTDDSKALKELSKKINNAAEKLAGVAKAVEKAGQIIETFVNLASNAITAGLI